MSFCGLRKPRPLRRRQPDIKGKGKSVQQDSDIEDHRHPGPHRFDVRDRRSSTDDEAKTHRYSEDEYEVDTKGVLLRRRQPQSNPHNSNHSHYPADQNSIGDTSGTKENNSKLKDAKYDDAEYAEYRVQCEEGLSTILEQYSESSQVGSRRGNTPTCDDEANIGSRAITKWDPPTFVPKFATSAFKKTRFIENVPETFFAEDRIPLVSMSYSGGRKTPDTPRSIAPPPRDLEAIARMDKSLIFEHFTTNDAWELGSALRNRLLPVPTPVVISISLANQNQVLFHTCTHSGVMPDNDNWVARKRRTVLRWGCSTWYMHCKFGGDENAFRQKYGLGNSAGDYAIHGGGVPIRVTGVEGVVAVVVVSGLKQDEDHGVIVEVIKELYY